MPKKLAHSFVLKAFQEQNYILHNTYYSSKTTLIYTCDKGHKGYITWNKFQSGRRCPMCWWQKRTYTHEQVDKFFKDQNCLLLGRYMDSKTKLQYKCSCGRHSSITWNNFQQGQRCMQCGNVKNSLAKKGKHNYNWIVDRDSIQIKRQLNDRCSALLHNCLARTAGKNYITQNILGYTTADLWQHLQCYPNFEQLQLGKWQIDHIFPVKAFIEHGITDPAIICSLSNLQPLSAYENQSKGANYNEECFKTYCSLNHIGLS